MIEKKNISLYVFLTIITFGIFGLVWLAKITKDVSDYTNDSTMKPGRAVFYTIITFGIYLIYWYYKVGNSMKIANDKKDIKSRDNTILYIILGLFGLGLINFAIIQNELNSVSKSDKKVETVKERLVNLWNYFTTYEKIWFFSILILSVVFAFLFPEEDVNGVNGKIIMGLYLLDIFLNILCELLISKQSKWNFIVSVFVELTEIATLIVLASRFATMATTLFFWLPIDIISFINWHKHPDKQEDDLTKVRKLSGWAEVLVILGIVVWTVGVGYLLTTLDVETDLFGGNELIETIVCYLDACVSAVGIANGVFILLRLREQWIAWYIDAILEGVINVLSGQWVLLVLKLGYLTNTTYGYIKWSKYIKEHKEEAKADNKLF